MRRIAVSAAVAASFAAAGCIAAIEAHDAAPAAPKGPHKEAVVPEGWEVAVESFGYSPAVISGDLVYLSGVVAGVPEGEITDEVLRQSYQRMFATIESVLNEAGASWDDVIEMTSFHTDMPAQIDVFMEVKTGFVRAPHPAWTAIDIDRLYPDRGITEVKVVARLPRRD